jgi:DNA modification methylase
MTEFFATRVIPVSELIPYALNSRTHSDAQVAQIASSIREFGFTNPLLVDESNNLIAGHGRLLAARKLGLDAVPAVVVTGLDDRRRRALIIADNKLALNAGWDEEALRVELEDLAGDFGALMGFDEDELIDILSGSAKDDNADPDNVPEIEGPFISKPGDVWALGPHRLVCGDSTSVDSVRLLMGDTFADACWTDPPYNVNYQSSAGSIKNDNMSDGNFYQFLNDAFVCAFAFIKPGSAVYVAHADTEGLNFRAAFKSAGFKLSGCLIWAKNSLVLGRSDYQWSHEPILYGWKPGASHRWYGGRKQTTVKSYDSSVFTILEDGRVQVRIGADSIILSGSDLKAEAVESTVIKCEKPKSSAEHPTMKPTELICNMLKNSTRSGDLVLDLFGGSGSTLIACEMLGRQARLMELDPKYCDVIVKRWQDFTGKDACLYLDGKTFNELADGKASLQHD